VCTATFVPFLMYCIYLLHSISHAFTGKQENEDERNSGSNFEIMKTPPPPTFIRREKRTCQDGHEPQMFFWSVYSTLTTTFLLLVPLLTMLTASCKLFMPPSTICTLGLGTTAPVSKTVGKNSW
jgi:hypothetical protein